MAYTLIAVAAWILGAVLSGLLSLVLAAVFFGWIFSRPGWRGPVTDHFDGTKFHNPPGGMARVASGDADSANRTGSFFRWILGRRRDKGVWAWVEEAPGEKPPQRVGPGELRATFVNHATVLLQFDGVNLLTDPVWSKRVSPFTFAGPKRWRNPGIRFEDLPPIDAVILSHNHYDHLDIGTTRRLMATHKPRYITGLGNAAVLRGLGVTDIVEMDWWQRGEAVPGVPVTCVPGQHFSSRGLFDRDRTLWAGFVVETKNGAIYFAGDTGWGPHFAEIRERCAPVRLALMPIGAFRPRWFMAPVHVAPEQALAAHDAVGAATSMAIHFGTFSLGDDGQTEPQSVLGAALDAHAAPRPDFRVLRHGEGIALPPLETGAAAPLAQNARAVS